ncbi:hypothetical protein [Geodermatophilus sp. CPCC 206100]|uniref:hypothetical protein n=1 Tax=Geodermatophilus sp. CPCC 206100 TaxID=3020054 RepID=UPI003B005E59
MGASEIDLARVPRGELAARALVDAVAAVDDRVERHFLEVKSAIDLKSKDGIAKVAKFILGAANRMPDDAARYFEGHAVMVLGVAAGSVSGIEPVEALDIERGVRPFLSVNGPRWDLQRVPIDSEREVLLILVDPPEWGQPPFPCHKDGQGLYSGQIIVRADGETRPATGEEVVRLLGRSRSVKPNVDLDVVVEGVAIAYICDERVLEDHIRHETERLHRAMMTPEPATPYARNMSLLGAMGQRRENRTSEEYEKQITDWADACRASWASALDSIAAMATSPVSVSLTNRGESFLEDVELQVHLAGPVRGVESVDREDFDSSKLLPAPPREWGPWTAPFPAVALRDFPYTPSLPSVPGPLTFTNGGSVTLHVDVGDLRPLGDFETEGDGMVLRVDAVDITEVAGRWKVTARGHHAVYEGDLSVPVKAHDITEAMEGLLRRVRGEDGPDEGDPE